MKVVKEEHIFTNHVLDMIIFQYISPFLNNYSISKVQPYGDLLLLLYKSGDITIFVQVMCCYLLL